jgi:RNase P subunit RPR2
MTKSVTVSCKNCGATVILELHNVNENTNQVGGVVTRACQKCYQTSVYDYRMQNGQFTELR